MLVRLAVLAVSLVVAAAASANPLIGTWKADPELTLLHVGETTTLALEQCELLLSPDPFGRLGAVYDEREIEFRLPEQSARLSNRIVATGSDFVDVEYAAEESDEAALMRLLVHEGLLYVPIEDTGFHGVFPRIDVPAAPAP